MSGIIDFHTHAFPDKLAERAMATLEAEAEAEGVTAYLNGKTHALLDSMDRAGIDKSVVCSIATRPEQFEAILQWSSSIRSSRLLPFPSVHPWDKDFKEHIKRIAGEGFQGIKFHPYYQDFYLDEDRVLPIYEAAGLAGLAIVMHTGFDIAFERIRRCDPARIMNVLKRFADLKLVTTHLGAWEDWDEVERLITGKPIFMEISFALESLGPERGKRMIEAHPEGYIMFGTDSPWTDQSATLGLLRGLGLAPARLDSILSGAARKLLGIS